MLTAQQAYDNVTNINSETNKKQLNEIEAQINVAIKLGKFECFVYYYLFVPVKKELKTLGYEVSSAEFRNEVTTKISWSEK